MAGQMIEMLRMSDKQFLTAADLAPILRSDPQAIRLAARSGLLGIPAICVGSRVKFSREAVLRALEGRQEA